MINETYREAAARWLIGANVKPPEIIALGTGTAPVASDDTALSAEYYRQAIDFKWSPRRFASRFAVSLPAMVPPPRPGQSSITFTEIGLFDGSMIGVGNHDFEAWSGTPLSPAYWSPGPGCVGSATRSTDAYEGSFAALIHYAGTIPMFLFQDLPLAMCAGKFLTFRCAVKTSAGSQARIGIFDGSSTTFSSFHSGGGAYEILQVGRAIGSGASRARLILHVNTSGTAAFDWIQCYESGRLWARSIIRQTKVHGIPLNLSWEISNEEDKVIRDAYDAEDLTIGTVSAGSLTPARYAPANQQAASMAFITVEDAVIRYWMHGGTPSGTTAHRSGTVDPIILEGANNIAQFRCLAIGASARLRVTYFR